MHNDHQPYYVTVGDQWTKIDYSQHPSTWMKPYTQGEETELIEIPASWWLDDLPPMMFIKPRPTVTASSIRATSSRCGVTSSTGSMRTMITLSSR
jgi:hypothetical protein